MALKLGRLEQQSERAGDSLHTVNERKTTHIWCKEKKQHPPPTLPHKKKEGGGVEYRCKRARENDRLQTCWIRNSLGHKLYPIHFCNRSIWHTVGMQ